MVQENFSIQGSYVNYFWEYENESEKFDKLSKKIREIPNIESVTPIIEGQAMASVRGSAAAAVVRGIRPIDLKNHKLI